VINSPKSNLAAPKSGREVLPRSIHQPCNSLGTRKSALILQFLRKEARVSRGKKRRPFYSIRAVARRFGVPATSVSRIYGQLKDEGLLTSVWGSKTFVEPVQMDNHLRVRAIVALPVSLTSFCTLREYRDFFVEMRCALWRCGFTTRLLFYGHDEGQLPTFGEVLLTHKPNIVIWFQPTTKLKETMARLFDRGIRVLTVADYSGDRCQAAYCINRERAINNAVLGWQQQGIRSVIVVKDAHCGLGSTSATTEKCLRDKAMPYVTRNVESLQWQEIFCECSQRANRGVIFTSSQTTAGFVRDPARFDELSRRSRILLTDGLIDVPGVYSVQPSIDIIAVDLKAMAKRIASDLIKPIRQQTEPVIFQAKWMAGRTIDTPIGSLHSIQPFRNARPHRLGEVRIVV